MTVLLIPCGKKPEIREIDGSLKSMQRLVGGLIEEIRSGNDTAALICNEEALPLNLEPRLTVDFPTIFYQKHNISAIILQKHNF